MTLPDFVTLQFCVDAIVAILLIVTIVYCAILHKKLSALRNAEHELQGLLQAFAGQTQKAENGILQLRSAAEDIGGTLGEQVESATELLDELKLITATGNDLAGRLEKSLVRPDHSRPSEPAGRAGRTASAAKPERSESEMALLRALREAS